MGEETIIFVNRMRVPDNAYAELRAIWQGLYGEARTISTERPGETLPFIEKIRPKNVFVVGGDGSENELLIPAMEYGFTLGIIPHGTGNDHATALGFSKDLKNILKKGDERAARTYLTPFLATSSGSEEYIRNVDVATIIVNGEEKKMAANCLGTGYFAEVNHAAQAYNGFTKPYLKITLQQRRERAKRGPDDITLTINGKETEIVRAANLDLLIGNYFGNHKHINPHGDITDGTAELFMLDSAKKTSFWPNILNVLSDTNLHLTNKHMDYRMGVHELEAIFDEPQILQYDGESMRGVRELYVRIEKQAIPMVVNSKS